MSAFPSAVGDLLARAADRGATARALYDAAVAVQRLLPDATVAELDDALHRMTESLPTLHRLAAAKVAITCGAVVERGGDPHIAGPGLVSLLPDVLGWTIRFHERCEEKARADGTITGENEDGDRPSPAELGKKYLNAVFADVPEAAWGYAAEEETTLAAIAHLARSKTLRKATEQRPELLELSDRLDGVFGSGRSFLTKMLLTLDDEPLLVLHPEQGKGYRLTASAIPDNFMLHTALMGHLLGDPAEGWIAAERIDLAAVRQAMRQLGDGSAPHMNGAFNLWNWTGVRADGTLPAPGSASEHWIWNEGVPADIAPFDGLRVVVLGPPPYSRGWPGGSIFGGLFPEVVVQEKLSADAVKEWMTKLASAPKPVA